MTSVTSSMTKRSIYLLLIALILVWGLSWPIAKLGLAYMPPLWFATYRIWGAVLIMFPIVMLIGKFVWPSKKDFKIILAVGIFQISLFMTLIILGLKEVPAGRSAILVYTTPIWVVPISVLFFKESTNILKWLGFILCLSGVAVLFNPLAMDWAHHNVLIGNGFLLLAALCWAIAILCARYMTWTRAPIELIAWQLLVAAIPLTILTLIKEPHEVIIWHPMLVFSLIYNAILATAFAYWGNVVINKELPPTVTSLSMLAVPVCALIFSAFLLHEPITLSILTAMALILGGVISVIIPNPSKLKEKSCL